MFFFSPQKLNLLKLDKEEGQITDSHMCLVDHCIYSS